MKFGVFDHLDRNDEPLAEFFENRLRIIEAYDKGGFHGYFVAEHHSTPLGMAPSPSVFLAAVAQRTKKLRFGPLIYALPLYHPLRLIEEICMLDQMSGGRLDIGFGRGASPIELSIYGVDPKDAEAIYIEWREMVLKGLSEKTLTYKGKHFSCENVPMTIEPLQTPHPPMWYGVHSPDSAVRAARQGLNVVSLDDAGQTATLSDLYRATWAEEGGTAASMPLIGLGRFIVVADTDEKALALARRHYPLWHRNFNALFRLHGSAPRHPRPDSFDGVMEERIGFAGAPDSVAEFVAAEMEQSGATYMIGQLAFGGLSFADTMRSVELFIDRVMPALEGATPVAAK
jgi:alkanesulfonate monooxygenase SsuD/methylene tetrahydromethanopterin reductase-like flavin-dependent oxidoreductase (luciferase family)